jgi:pSer/pThr/pTyr-binding forkhead associated (FHA) protein
MKAELRVQGVNGSQNGLGLNRLGSYTIGRRTGNDLSISDKSISRKHCRIDFDGENFWLIDCGSHNGTYVNGRRVSRCMLYDGDLIRLGKVKVDFHRAAEPAEEQY